MYLIIKSSIEAWQLCYGMRMLLLLLQWPDTMEGTSQCNHGNSAAGKGTHTHIHTDTHTRTHICVYLGVKLTIELRENITLGVRDEA